MVCSTRPEVASRPQRLRADMMFSPGLSMRLLQSRKGLSCFAFEHNEEYQQTQLRFLSAVESMEPNNIVVRVWGPWDAVSDHGPAHSFRAPARVCPLGDWAAVLGQDGAWGQRLATGSLLSVSSLSRLRSWAECGLSWGSGISQDPFPNV